MSFANNTMSRVCKIAQAGILFLLVTGCTAALAQTKAVFLKDGQLYKAEYPRYDATRLTDDPGVKRSPRWSPNGNRILFLDPETTKDSIGTLVIMSSAGSIMGRYPVATVLPNGTPISGMGGIDNIGWLDQTHIYAVGSVNPYIAEFRAIDLKTRALTGLGGSGFAACTSAGTVAFWSAVYPPKKSMELHTSTTKATLFEFRDTDKLPTLNIPLAWDDECDAVGFVDPTPPLHLVVIGTDQRRTIVPLPEKVKEIPALFGTENGFIVGSNGKLKFNRANGALGNTPDSVVQEIVRDRVLRDQTEAKHGGSEWDWWTAAESVRKMFQRAPNR